MAAMESMSAPITEAITKIILAFLFSILNFRSRFCSLFALWWFLIPDIASPFAIADLT